MSKRLCSIESKQGTLRSVLLKRWAAKLLQMGRELFRDDLNIF